VDGIAFHPVVRGGKEEARKHPLARGERAWQAGGMSSVATMPQVEPSTYRFSVEEYYKLGEVGIFHPRDRVELLDGEIIVMSPIGLRHIQAVNWCNDCLVEQHRRRYLVSPGNPIWLHEYSEPQPDMMLVPRVRKLSRQVRPEDVFLLVEISDSSLAYDRERKRTAYAEAGVREYWIVNLQEDIIEVFREPADGKYIVMLSFAPGQQLSPLAFEDVIVPVSDIIPPR
jgi:Uma2 family endonuclease